MLYFRSLTYIQLDGLNRLLIIERFDGLLYIILEDCFVFIHSFDMSYFQYKIVLALQILFSITPFQLFGRVFDALHECSTCRFLSFL